jgi:hypothetical protein
MLWILTALLAAQPNVAAKDKQPAPTPPEIVQKRQAYVEVRRQAWTFRMNGVMSRLAQSRTTARRMFRAKKFKAKLRGLLGKIADLEKAVRAEQARARSPKWIPDLEFSRPVLHAAGRVKTSDRLTVRVEKILGPGEVLCSVTYREVIFTAKPSPVRYEDRTCSDRFLFRIPTKDLLETKIVPLKGTFAIVDQKGGATVRKPAKKTPKKKRKKRRKKREKSSPASSGGGAWIVEPVDESELLRKTPPKAGQ